MYPYNDSTLTYCTERGNGGGMVGEGWQGMDGFDNDDMEGPRCQCPWEWVLYREICLSPTHDHQHICRKQHFHCQIFCRLYEWIFHILSIGVSGYEKLAHFLCNQFRSDIQKTRLQDVDDYKQRQVCIPAAEEKYPRKKGDTMTAQLILGRFFLLLSTKKRHLFTSICTHH